MFQNRPCGCKGRRSCLECEERYGAWNTVKEISEKEKSEYAVYCPLCQLAWPGWEGNSWAAHPHHTGQSVQVPGVLLVLDFVSEAEEADLLRQLDEVPWDTSQSGRLKQNYGPKCNFKKQKVKLDGFGGYPAFTKMIQERFNSIPLLRGFQTVEQCSLDYTPSRGASIDPHIDDCWIWGERIPTLSLMTDSVLMLTKYSGPQSKYNLLDVKKYPRVVDENGQPKSMKQLNLFYEDLQENSNGTGAEETGIEGSAVADTSAATEEIANTSEPSDLLPNLIRLPMPRRSLLVLFGAARYQYEHSVLRNDLPSRRVCITYRELTPTFLSCGPKAQVGAQILNVARQFWDHKQVYKDSSEDCEAKNPSPSNTVQ